MGLELGALRTEHAVLCSEVSPRNVLLTSVVDGASKLHFHLLHTDGSLSHLINQGTLNCKLKTKCLFIQMTKNACIKSLCLMHSIVTINNRELERMHLPSMFEARVSHLLYSCNESAP